MCASNKRALAEFTHKKKKKLGVMNERKENKNQILVVAVDFIFVFCFENFICLSKLLKSFSHTHTRAQHHHL